MKNAALALVLFITTATFAQNRIEKDLPEFNEIKVFDLIEAELIKAEKNEVIVTGANIDDVKITTDDDGILKIRMMTKTRFNGNDTNVKVYFTNVNIIDANEGAKITSEAVLRQKSIIIKCQEGGEVHVDLDTEIALFKSVSGGSIHVKGSSNFQEITVNSGGAFRGEDLKSLRTEVNVTAGGFADVNASEYVDAKVTAGGTINIYGNPKKVKKKKRLGGKIKMIN